MSVEATNRPFRVCAHCGLLTPAAVPACAECGQLAPDVMHEARERFIAAKRDDLFTREFFSRRAPFTYGFLIVNVFVFVLMTFAGGSDGLSILIAFGAKVGGLIDRGQYWRFVTPIFIHAGIIHLLLNSYALYVLGPQVEKLYGSARFVVLYLASGVSGVVASYLFTSKDVPSVGASGALFGMIGVLTVFGLKYRRELPGVFRRSFGIAMAPVILINLFIGFTISGIDNAAHLGGMAGGMLLAMAIPYQAPGRRASGLFWRAAQVMSLAVIPLSFAFAAHVYDGPSLSFESARQGLLEGQNQRVRRYVDAINQGRREFLEAAEKGDYSGIDEGIVTLESAPRLDEKAGALAAELEDLLRKLKSAHGHELATGELSGRAGLMSDFRKFSADFSAWTESDGRMKYGIRFSQPGGQNGQ